MEAAGFYPRAGKHTTANSPGPRAAALLYQKEKAPAAGWRLFFATAVLFRRSQAASSGRDTAQWTRLQSRIHAVWLRTSAIVCFHPFYQEGRFSPASSIDQLHRLIPQHGHGGEAESAPQHRHRRQLQHCGHRRIQHKAQQDQCAEMSRPHHLVFHQTPGGDVNGVAVGAVDPGKDSPAW